MELLAGRIVEPIVVANRSGGAGTIALQTLMQHKSDGDWIATESDLWDLERAIDQSPHRPLLNRSQIAGLRRADEIEIKAGKLVEW